MKKKTARKKNLIFLIVNFPMRTELAFFYRVSYITITDPFCSVKCIFEVIFYRRSLNLDKNCAESEQNHAIYPVFTQKFKPR